MQKIILATSNPHKVEEINKITEGLGYEFVMPFEGFDPVEDGESFEENAFIKASVANESSGMLTLADDSGLCVEALSGEPGIHSARYAGSQDEKIQKLLHELKDVPESKRGAKFVCAMVLLGPEGDVIFSDRGECFGHIALEPKGMNGFGYDPIFLVEGGDLTMAEMPENIKNSISHRGLALQKVIKFLQQANKNEYIN